MNYSVTNGGVVLNYDGKTTIVARDDKRYEGVLQCIRERRLGDIPALVEIERQFADSGLVLQDGILYENDGPIPAELNSRIILYKEQGIPYDSLLKFWNNLKQNPSFNARQMLFAFLTHNGHPFTEDGCFIAYRGVTAEFKDVHTGKFNNSVGSVCEMDRSKVDDNPNNTCSSGLHVACFDYAKGFGTQLIEVKVNPKDVVAVPVDYNGTKMRTCRFEVVAVGEKLREEVLYGHAQSHQVEDEEEYEDTNSCPHCEEEAKMTSKALRKLGDECSFDIEICVDNQQLREELINAKNRIDSAKQTVDKARGVPKE